MDARKDSLPWVIALVTLGAALGLAAAMYFENRRLDAAQDDSDTPLFI